MTATSTSSICTDQQPALYRLAHQSRWSSSSDLTGLHDRLAYLSSLHHSSASPRQQAVPTSGIGSAENVRVENNSSTPPTSPAQRARCKECSARKRALSELHYTDVHTHRTALHILCYWRPRLHLVSQFLELAPHMVWSRSSSGETALHLACSNGTRMAGADVIDLLLDAAERTTSSDADETNAEPKAQRRRRYALLTDERGWTALHCAVQADAPKSVLEALLNAAPEAAIMGGGHATSAKTPIDLLYQTYDLFVEQYLNCKNEQDEEGIGDDDTTSNDTNADIAIHNNTLPDTLCHFWDKLAILLRAGCQALQKRPCEELPILHATLILMSSHNLQMPPSLLQLIMVQCLDEQVHLIDANGGYALHYGAQALANDAVDGAIVQQLLRANPRAARQPNSGGIYPLQLILQKRGGRDDTCNRLIRDMVRAYPPAILGTSAFSDELAPYIVETIGHQNIQAKAGQQISDSMGNVFNLLRTQPSLMEYT